MELKVFDKVTLSLVKVISINFELNSLEIESTDESDLTEVRHLEDIDFTNSHLSSLSKESIIKLLEYYINLNETYLENREKLYVKRLEDISNIKYYVHKEVLKALEEKDKEKYDILIYLEEGIKDVLNNRDDKSLLTDRDIEQIIKLRRFQKRLG
ncbi:hypothetical protein SEP1_127 [Staphylococcus phage phiIBB-SEP1]|uniref:Uncharacterized protein n=1 Tax=Staphylococcus phage phiIBB-SEP1 TaxID=1340769 RepID=W5R8W1_9CAUD|nr:hypothetical protein FDH45_gp125 [Staphylococcus phage phiIBB-SEP1]AGR48253.1 hypothetical protein SEP1_127 [Staphylococcus phage phiIBB-SEP1]AXF38639.1 hypothetical protein Twillingate_206 [Staphylococcus phage Twillingate]MDU1018350.1 hypothetical protein [Clostridium perfringens]QLF86939.1 hypothetical protein BESEP4_00205 [Staphylococcus phage vB_SepM_BE04]